MHEPLMIIGIGPHARRIYIPALERFGPEYDSHVAIGVDLEEKREEIERFLGERGNPMQMSYVQADERAPGEIHPRLAARLDALVEEHNIRGVIIATEPLTHKRYAEWALRRGHFILMDKPVTTHEWISTDASLAERLVSDYDSLAERYAASIGSGNPATFSVMAQRRFHPVFQYMRAQIASCFEKTECPITSFQTFHCDGQWRMPVEMVEQLYHPYKQGYGKCSHSGYHFFDIIPFLLGAGLGGEKQYDEIEVMAAFSRPNDFLAQLTLEDHARLLGEEFVKRNKYSTAEFEVIMKRFGEIDSFSTIAFKNRGRTMTLGSINLAHNGFSRRDWPTAEGRDLYKGNGRVRQESHVLQQGPFQSIHYHSYQASEITPGAPASNDVGGENHSEIYLFRNSGMIGGAPVEVFNADDLASPTLTGYSRGHQEDARAKGIIEFIESLHGIRSRGEMTSDFLSHRAGVVLMASTYLSAIRREQEGNPHISFPFSFRRGGLMHDTRLCNQRRWVA